jgi:hypothetical protein
MTVQNPKLVSFGIELQILSVIKASDRDKPI